MTIAERIKKIENAPQDLFEMFPRYKLDHGIELEDSGETLRLFFVGDEGWDEDCGGCYCVDAYDKTGTRYCITYTVPELERDEGEAEFCACQEVDKDTEIESALRRAESETEYLDRCAEAIDWETPYLVECFDDDYWTSVLLYNSDEPHDGITIQEFVD